MRIKKKFNNSVILAEDEHKVEQVLIGKGISFDKKIGDEINPELIEKRYVLDNSNVSKNFENILDNVNPQYLYLANRIIQDTENKLKCSICNSTIVGLTDHIDFAIQRAKEDVSMPNALLWEIKKFYPNEYECAKKGVELIHHYENIWLSDDEAGYIALHLVNGQQKNQDMNDTYQMTQIVKQIIKIIKFHFNIAIDEDSLNYARLVTHLKYFAMRAMKKETIVDITKGTILNSLSKQYPDVYSCIKKIEVYIEKAMNFKLNDEEYTYLMLHIIRVVKNH